MIRYLGVVKLQWKFFVRNLPMKQKMITYLVSYTVLSPNISPLCLFKGIENNFFINYSNMVTEALTVKRIVYVCTFWEGHQFIVKHKNKIWCFILGGTEKL